MKPARHKRARLVGGRSVVEGDLPAQGGKKGRPGVTISPAERKNGPGLKFYLLPLLF